jgi:predicted nuclease of predicted toxin-antitoxin system
MRFLGDNALSPLVARELKRLGHDAVHVRDWKLAAADDEDILQKAIETDRIILSADTDFGFILAKRQACKPSFLLFRGNVTRDPMKQVELLRMNLPQCETDLQDGAVVVIDGARVRVRRLPFSR